MAKQTKVVMAAIEAVRTAKEQDITLSSMAERAGIDRSTLKNAKVLVEFGSIADLFEVTSGKIGLHPIADRIKATLTDEQRKQLKQTSTWNANRRKNLQEGAALWAKLGPALTALVELPKPQDMVEIVKSNTMRENSINQNLDAATKWLEEFAHEWSKIRLQRAQSHPVDTRDSSKASGA
jgi:hypothetical protein